MFKDLLACMADIAKNRIAAGAVRIEVTVRNHEDGFVEIELADDGKGMDVERCGGKFEISSVPGKGTKVKASFSPDDIGAAQAGDMAGAFLTLITDAPDVHWIFRHGQEGSFFELDSEELGETIGGLEYLSVPDVAVSLKALTEDGIAQSMGIETHPSCTGCGEH